MTDESVSKVQELPQYSFPNKMGRIMLLAMEEVMGRNGVNAVLNLARLPHRTGDYPPNNSPDKSFCLMIFLISSPFIFNPFRPYFIFASITYHSP